MIICRDDFSRLFKPRGIFKMTVRKAGKIIEQYEDHNLIVNNAKLLMAHLIAGDTTGKSIAKIAFGTNGTTPTPGDAMITNAFLKPVSNITYPGYLTEEVNWGPVLGLPTDLVTEWLGYQVRFDWELLTTEDNGQAISEFGLLSGNQTLFNRKTRNNPIHKEPDISIEGSWIITF
jgi:hypothetical protein